MLPCPRCDEHLYPVPKFDLDRDDVSDFINELRGFHEQFAECFQRSESRVYCFRQVKRKKVLVVDFLLRGSSEASSPVPA